MAQYISDRRGYVSFLVKEVLRRASSPTMEDDVKLKRIGKYVKGMPRCVQDFPWREGNEVVLKCFADSDWSGELDTRRSTSGGVCTISDGVEMELKHLCLS